MFVIKLFVLSNNCYLNAVSSISNIITHLPTEFGPTFCIVLKTFKRES